MGPPNSSHTARNLQSVAAGVRAAEHAAGEAIERRVAELFRCASEIAERQERIEHRMAALRINSADADLGRAIRLSREGSR